MEELVIQTHSFETSKNQLKKFSEQTTTNLDLKKVDTSKGVGEWFEEWLKGGGIGKDHKVTGEELNGLTTQIQTHLVEINNMQRTFIQEFGQVYNALEALDKDYIQAILIAVKSAQEANQEVKVAQDDIEKTIALQKKTIKVLEQFKEKIDKYKYLNDVDKMWGDIQNLHNSILAQKKSISSLEKFKCQIEKNKHLSDVDVVYDDVQICKNEVYELKDTIVKQEKLITNLKNNLQDVQSRSEEIESKLSNKIKIAYLLTGISVGIVVIMGLI